MESAETVQQMPVKKGISKKQMMMVGGGVLVVALLIGGYFAFQASQDPQAKAKAEADAVVRQVARHMVLPDGETPTVATVSDPSKLKDQRFFANAKKGDKVLIYSGAQKAILYDPQADRIIEVAPVNIGGAQ